MITINTAGARESNGDAWRARARAAHRAGARTIFFAAADLGEELGAGIEHARRVCRPGPRAEIDRELRQRSEPTRWPADARPRRRKTEGGEQAEAREKGPAGKLENKRLSRIFTLNGPVQHRTVSEKPPSTQPAILKEIRGVLGADTSTALSAHVHSGFSTDDSRSAMDTDLRGCLATSAF